MGRPAGVGGVVVPGADRVGAVAELIVELPVVTGRTKDQHAEAKDVVAGLVGVVVVDRRVGRKRELAAGAVEDAAAATGLVVAHDGELGTLVKGERAVVLEAVAAVVADLDHRAGSHVGGGAAPHGAQSAAALGGIVVDRHRGRAVDVHVPVEVDARVAVGVAGGLRAAGQADVAGGHAVSAVGADVEGGAVTTDIVGAVGAVATVVRVGQLGVVDRDLDAGGDAGPVARNAEVGAAEDVELGRICRGAAGFDVGADAIDAEARDRHRRPVQVHLGASVVVDAMVDVAGRGEGHLRVVEGERAVVVDDARRPGVTITSDGRRAEGRRQVERHVVEGEAGALVAILGDVDAVVVRRDGVVVALDRDVGAMDAKALLGTRVAEKFDGVAILRGGKRVVEAAVGCPANLCDGLGGRGATGLRCGLRLGRRCRGRGRNRGGLRPVGVQRQRLALVGRRDRDGLGGIVSKGDGLIHGSGRRIGSRRRGGRDYGRVDDADGLGLVALDGHGVDRLDVIRQGDGGRKGAQGCHQSGSHDRHGDVRVNLSHDRLLSS